ASARGGAVEVSWRSNAAASRVQLADLDSGTPVGEPVVVRGSRAVLPGSASGVWVDALPGGRAVGVVGAGDEGGTGATWQIFAPWDFRRGALSATFPDLASGERLGVLLVNYAGADGAPVEVMIDGTSDVPEVPAQVVSGLAAVFPALHEAARAREAALALEAPAPTEQLQARSSFCVVRGLDFSHHLRKPATLALATAHASIYLDDDDLGEYERPVLQPLAQAFEDRVWPATTSTAPRMAMRRRTCSPPSIRPRSPTSCSICSISPTAACSARARGRRRSGSTRRSPRSPRTSLATAGTPPAGARKEPRIWGTRAPRCADTTGAASRAGREIRSGTTRARTASCACSPIAPVRTCRAASRAERAE